MEQRSKTRGGVGTVEGQEGADLRRQLEGGLETLEAATTRFRTLSATLLRRDWKARLRRQPELLAAARAREPEVLEALEALRRRAAREPGGAAEAVLREVEGARDALAEAIADRLQASWHVPLTERMALLEARVFPPSPRPPGEGEQRLAEGNPVLPSTGVLAVLLPLLVLLGLLADPGAAALLLALVVVITYLSGSRYRLTSERLILQPRWGKPVEVPLASIDDGELSVRPFLGSIRLRAHGVTLRHLRRPRALATLLSIRRRKEFRQVAASPAPSNALVLRARMGPLRTTKVITNPDVLLSRPLDEEYEPDDEALLYEGLDGYLVLRPGLIAFLPCGYSEEVAGRPNEVRAGAFLLNALTEPTGSWVGPEGENRDAVAVDAEEVAKHLRLLPGEELERLLRHTAARRPFLVGQVSIQRWNPTEVEYSLRARSELSILQGGYWLRARFDEKTHEDVARMIARWPRRERLTASGPGTAGI